MIKLKIGNDYQQNENSAKSIDVTVSQDLADYSLYLEFKNEKGKFCSEKLTVDSDSLSATYSLPKGITQYEGRFTVQAVAVSDNNSVEKSAVEAFTVAGSINATEQIAETENDIITDIIADIAQLRNSASAGESLADIVRYATDQSLTDTQKTKARTNIGAGTSNFSGSFNDLTDVPEVIGQNGTDGVDGQDGADGKSAYEIAVENGFVGTESEWLLSLKGEKGDTGATGATGQNGANGKSAYEIAVENGYPDDEFTWLASLYGLSCYEIACREGFNGTKAQWLASLKGEDGENGSDGADGEDGATFTPSVSAEGLLSWTNDKGLDNPAPVNIKGADGENGGSGGSATVTLGDNSTVTLADSTEYRGNNISTLTFQYPVGNFECWLKLTFAESGEITVTIPESTYIGKAPVFANGDTWEISIKDSVIVAQKVGDGT